MNKEFKDLLEKKGKTPISPSIWEMGEILVEATKAIEEKKLNVSNQNIDKIINECGHYFSLQKNEPDTSFREEDLIKLESELGMFIEAIRKEFSKLRDSKYNDDFDYANMREEEIDNILNKVTEAKLEKESKENVKINEVKVKKAVKSKIVPISVMTEILKKGALKIATNELKFDGRKIDEVIQKCDYYFQTQNEKPESFSKEIFKDFKNEFNSFVDAFYAKSSELKRDDAHYYDFHQIDERDTEIAKLVKKVTTQKDTELAD